MSKSTKSEFYIDRVDKNTIKDLLYTHHYLKDESQDFRSGWNYGLFKRNEWSDFLNIGECLGACVFNNITGKNFALGAFGIPDTEQEGLYELTRLCIEPNLQKEEYNITSWFLSKCIKRFRQETDVKVILSYADNNHHRGTIYRACNFAYYGLTDYKTDFWKKLPDGSFRKVSHGPVKHLEGEWRPRSQKHRFLMIYDKQLKQQLKLKEQTWSNAKEDI